MFGPDEPENDRRLRAELDNLRAARDLARAHGRDDVRVGITVWLDEPSLWRDLRELWQWALELAADRTLADHPQRVAVLGCAAEAARLFGDLDLAAELADEAIALAGPDPDPVQVHRAWRAHGAVAHFRGDFAAAAEGWLRSGDGRPVVSGAYVASAALATAYGGDPAAARALLDRAHAANAASRCVSHAAFAAYVEGELRATTDVEQSVPYYLEAIDGARRAGANFVVGIASVALASARTRIGDVSGRGRRVRLPDRLLAAHRADHPAVDHRPQRRRPAVDRWATRLAALLLICADDAPGAAAVGPQIARLQRPHVHAVGDLVDVIALAQLRAEAGRLGSEAVLDRAAAELRDLAAGPGDRVRLAPRGRGSTTPRRSCGCPARFGACTVGRRPRSP